MNNIITFLKYQYRFLLGLILFLIVPFYLSCIYLEQVSFKHYFFLLILVIFKLIVVDEKKYQAKIRQRVISDLTHALKKNPSRDQIFKKLNTVSKGRDISILIVGIVILSSGFIIKA